MYSVPNYSANAVFLNDFSQYSMQMKVGRICLVTNHFDVILLNKPTKDAYFIHK